MSPLKVYQFSLITKMHGSKTHLSVMDFQTVQCKFYQENVYQIIASLQLRGIIKQ